MTTLPAYVLITPAKDEEVLIGRTIESVIQQTVRPAEWIIVSDGSTDRTDAIVSAAAQEQPWIKLIALPLRKERNFAAVVRATEVGLRALRTTHYQYIGLLDSDVAFQPDYFEILLRRFESQPNLGLAGGVTIDLGDSKTRFPRNRQDVPGATQFFRRGCFESLGTLLAIPEGGWDALTCARARMNGYETELFTDLVVDHLKPRNIAEGNVLRRRWQMGVRDHALGYHPLFELVKCATRITEKPWLIGACAWLIGYGVATIKRRSRMIPPDLLSFLRKEQMSRLFRKSAR